MRYLGDVMFWLTTGLCIAAIGVVALYVKRAGTGWLLGFLVLSLVSQLGFYVPNLLLRMEVLDVGTYRKFAEDSAAVFQILRLTAWVLLFAFIFALKSWVNSSAAAVGSAAAASPTASTPHDAVAQHVDPLCGVRGWLKFIVIANLYVAPILIAMQYIFAWIGFAVLADRHPGIVVVGIIWTGVDGVLTYMGIQAAMALRDIRPRAVQQMKRLLMLRLGWALLGTPLMFLGWSLSGLDPETLISDAIKTVLLGVIGFAVGWSYFSVSKRVKATYPDWNA